MQLAHALIIDDNTKNVNVLVHLLTREGITSTQVTNPALLETTLRDVAHVDIVFLDLEMPDIDGYTVLNELLADSRFQSVPVVAYTVHVSEINTAYQQGFHSFLGKPLDPDKFPGQVARILRGESVWELG